MRFSLQQIAALRGLNIIVASLFLLNLAFIVHNICRYIVGLKIHRTLIVLFYALILVSTVCRIVETAGRAIDPEHAFFKGEKKYEKLSGEIALFAIICIGLTLIVTINQLTLSLQVIQLEIGYGQLKLRSFVVRACSVSAALIYAITCTYIDLELTKIQEYWLWISYFSLLSVTYIITIIKLNNKMLKLPGDFEPEIKSINCQFAVFLVSYVTRLAWFIAQIATNDRFSTFGGCLFLSGMQLVWNILPVFFSIYSHHQVFRKVDARTLHQISQVSEETRSIVAKSK